ncbi:MAG: RNA polymerase sigma factor [Candidatus Krumholzibacteriota bacterium]
MREPQGANQNLADLTPDLVARLRAGDAGAGNMLHELYQPPLVRYCFRFLASKDEAEDVVQEVFLRVLKNKAQPENFRAWIYKITRNRCLDMIRRRGRRRDDQALPTASRLDADLTGCLTKLVRREQRAHLRRALAELPENQREVLHLRYAEDLSRIEIALVLDISENIVKSRLYEGMVKLRAHDSLVDRR